MHFTDDEREGGYEAERARHLLEHGECRQGPHRVGGSRTMHCLSCCPPPLSEDQKSMIRRILTRR